MTLPAADISDDVLLRSELLGELVVPRSELISFPAGLYGFSECRTFALVPTAREGLFWLQSADHSALASRSGRACTHWAISCTSASVNS